MGRDEPDRYEPLPGLPELPGWLWRRTSPVARIAIGLALVGIVVALVLIVPNLKSSQQLADERTAREKAAERAQLARELEAEQRPIERRYPGGGTDTQLAARERMMDSVRASIQADARARVRRGALKGPIKGVTCDPFPNRVGATGADRDLDRRRGRFSCVAVTAEFSGGVIGHQYRVLADFGSGRYGFCKITGRPGPEEHQIVTIPPACGGDAH
jgi:hypothetical protein